MLNIYNFLIIIGIIYILFFSFLKNNTILYVSLIEVFWIHLVVVFILLLNFFNNLNYIIGIIFIFIIASVELAIILLYIYTKI